ncbi:MAG: hypothetical protein ACOC2T_04030 [Planctomycetota bacterium]
MISPIRIIRNRLVERSEDGLRCRMRVSGIVVVGAMVLGVAGMLATLFVPGRQVDAAHMVMFVLSPSIGLALTSLFLLGYARVTEVSVEGNKVVSSERLFGLGLARREWDLEDFETVNVSVRSPGRESSPGNYCVIVLAGNDRDLPLFDVDDYSEARKAAAELTAVLNL